MTVDEAPEPALPSWAVATPKRRRHIARVVALLDAWAAAMGIDEVEARAWHDAGRWHDALRDESAPTLRALTGDADAPEGLLHGPAAARRLAAAGETRIEVLDAIRWHTVGHPRWSRTGRALYMADFLEPGRSFMAQERAFLASLVPSRFDDVFRLVVQRRLEWVLREGRSIAPETVALWNAVR